MAYKFTNHGFSDEEITRLWNAFRSGKAVETIARENNVKVHRVERITSGIMEVYEDDVPAMIADRRAGMSKAQIADKYGYSMAAVRFYLQDVPKGPPDTTPREIKHKLTFAEEWEQVCRRLNPKAWEGRT